MTERNEGAFLLEWIAHHRVMGVSDFLILSNDCQDGSDDMLDRLEQMGEVTHLRNDGPFDKSGIQFTALKRAQKHPLTQQADWIITLDVDEFINVHTGAGTLPDLVAALPEADAITLTWRLYGNAGVLAFEDRPVTEQFTRAAPEVMHWPWRASMFKTLYRNNGTYRKPGVHRPRSPDAARLAAFRWFDGNGHELDETFRLKRIFSTFGRSNTALVQLNHYPLGAMESYLLKRDRGRAVHGADELGMDYWVERNFNTDEDTSILRHKEAVAQEVARLKSDADIARCHDRAVAWRRVRLDELLQDEPYRALLGRLMMTPPTRPLDRAEASVLLSHAQRAQRRNA